MVSPDLGLVSLPFLWGDSGGEYRGVGVVFSDREGRHLGCGYITGAGEAGGPGGRMRNLLDQCDKAEVVFNCLRVSPWGKGEKWVGTALPDGTDEEHWLV